MRQANLAATVLAACALFCAQARAADWPQFGFDAAHTSNQTNERHLSRNTVRGLRFAWSVDVPAPLFVNDWHIERPAVGGGRLYAATGGGFGSPCTPPCGAGLFAFDAETGGAPLWSQLLAGGAGGTQPSYQHVPGVVWLADLGGNLERHDAASGRLLDVRHTGSPVAVTLENPFAYIVGSDSLTRLSPTGVDWSVSGLAITNEVAVFHGVVYATGNTAAGSFAWAIRAADGRVLWQTQLPDSASMPVVDSEGVYMGGGSLMALDPRDGSLEWRNDRVFAITPPALASHRLVFSAEDPNFGLFAADARTGAFLWQNDITGEGQCVPALANGVAFVVSENGFLVAVNTATGETLAKLGDPDGLPLDGGLNNATQYPQVAVAGSRVYATTANPFGPNRIDVFDLPRRAGGT